MNKYELIPHLRELDFREIDQLFAKLLGLAVRPRKWRPWGNLLTTTHLLALYFDQ
jgi:hypothetical protein